MKYLKFIRKKIDFIICWLYFPIFQKFIPPQTFRYAVSGGSNTILDISLYFLTYNYVLHKKIIHLGFISISAHIGAFLIVFPITFTTGFFLSKYITFTQSYLRGKIQLFRYGVTVLICILLNYVFLNFFVDFCHLYPTPSKILTSGLVVIYSYFSQKFYSFKIETVK
jgi:putative flippase GtrA